eukprot:CAMPEP_0177462402 /NCGR_PEP_ID=MMETSP0369-20130122/15741_1 /TAXON_ID=447022 ORGANISM="Scrippsiella hangoei-like, Strain SHHI-4" /NCGR_SAMPLE_ID=MMETSP0369 /ASSEMBLY_ACC=CAM_ASM_000364 /LENGTH=177 /DNA_ID=CAMNT_0018935977 /DNA_START=10 /DNA_END=543 /DNA_ORIENTATION=-
MPDMASPCESPFESPCYLAVALGVDQGSTGDQVVRLVRRRPRQFEPLLPARGTSAVAASSTAVSKTYGAHPAVAGVIIFDETLDLPNFNAAGKILHEGFCEALGKDPATTPVEEVDDGEHLVAKSLGGGETFESVLTGLWASEAPGAGGFRGWLPVAASEAAAHCRAPAFGPRGHYA